MIQGDSKGEYITEDVLKAGLARKRGQEK